VVFRELEYIGNFEPIFEADLGWESGRKVRFFEEKF
jgi:hypothetical protein